MKLTKKTAVWLFGIPVLVGAYLIYKEFTKPTSKVPAGDDKTGTPISTKPKIDTTKLPVSDFPLKMGVGSKKNPNKSVMALQDELGNLVIDGIFGAKTLAALQAQTGKSQIADANDLQATLEQIWAQDAASDATVNKGDLSDTIIFNTENGASEIWVNVASAWRGVDNNSGVWVYNDQQYNVNVSDSFSTADFVPYLSDSSTGMLILKSAMQPSFSNPYPPRAGSYFLVDPTTIQVS